MILNRIALVPAYSVLCRAPVFARVPIARYSTAQDPQSSGEQNAAPQETAAELAKQLEQHSNTPKPAVVLPSQATVSAEPPAPPLAYSPSALPPRQDPLLHFLVNLIMRDGKKARAERWVSDMLVQMAQLTHSNPVPLVYEAVNMTRPLLRMQSRKQGGKTMQVPIPLNERQSTRRALVWIIEASDRRLDRKISRRLAVEMLAVLEGNSSVHSRRDEVHKIGTNNRANASVRI